MKFAERLSLCWRILRAKPGNLLKHAEMELPPAKGDSTQAHMNQGLKELVLVFSTHGHSGFSASYATSALAKLLAFQPLGPLTGEDGEWFDHGNNCVQNKRCGHVFKGDPERFGGQAYDIDAVVFREANGSCFTGRGSAQPVTFPYTPRRIYVDVDAEGKPLDGWNRERDSWGRDSIHPEWLAGAPQ